MKLDKVEKAIVASSVLWLVLFVAVCVSWVVNIKQLTMECDFEPDYSCEVIHGLGVIPTLSIVTVWFDTDK